MRLTPSHSHVSVHTHLHTRVAPPLHASRRRVVDIIALGLRNLAPYNMLPIHNPFMEFDAGDMKNARSTGASHLPSGSNPNFVEHIRLPITLPANPLYAPALNIRVRDTRLGGFSKPTIGTCSIPLAALIPDPDGLRPPEQHRARADAGNPFVVEVCAPRVAGWACV